MLHPQYNDYSDDILCLHAASGDRIAEEELVIRYSRLVRICARPLFLAGGSGEDLIQEGMLGLLSAVREYSLEKGATFKVFAEYCIRNRLRSAIRFYSSGKHGPLNRSVSFETPMLDARYPLAPSVASESGPEENYIRQENYTQMMDTLRRRLSGFEAQVLSSYLDGFSYSEIGARLGKTPKSVDNAVQRIRRKLGQQLDLALSAKS